MKTFTTTLPDDLFENLDERAKHLAIPKNKLIERALRIYLDQIKKAKYIASFKKAVKHDEILLIAEEGMAGYLNELEA